MDTLVESIAVPLRPYPGIKEAFGDLVEAMTSVVREESGSDLNEWVSREMHAATAADIVALVDAATEHVVAGTPLPKRHEAIRRLDLLRTEISRRMAYEQVRQKDIADEIIDGILGVIALADADLYEHLDAVGVLSSRIAIVMGKDVEMAKTCLNVGRLHDVGKMAIPRSILYKPGKLEPDEYDLVKRHADAGYRMVVGIPGVARYAPAVRAHHERMDGSGYPDHLVGSAILLESRIVAVADVFHAMTSERCYRAPLEPKIAINEIIKGRRRLFDEVVVDAALQVFGSNFEERAVA